MIQFLADENVPRASVESLRLSGIDIVPVFQQGAADVAVLEQARAEDRLLVTFDRDFGELIYRNGEPSPRGIVFLRFVPVSPEEPAAVLLTLLEHPTIGVEGLFTIVTREQVRQRPLP